VAYIWFNRFCALRFMDVNRYTRIGVVSPAEGQFQPEILAEAKMGHIDEEMVPRQSPAADLRSARRQSAQPRSAGRSLPPAGGRRLQLLEQGHAVPVPAHR
jgi:hypothetical protein